MEREYGHVMPTITEEDVVIDLGAHIGGFSYYAWRCGSRNIMAYEADPSNYAIAAKNLNELAGIRVFHFAVVRSDDRKDEPTWIEEYPWCGPTPEWGVNTGGAGLFWGDRVTEVPHITLDEIIGETSVRILKVDIEGSEWPVLYTTKALKYVQTIIGEYHELSPEIEKSLGLPIPCTVGYLMRKLGGDGFRHVAVQPSSLPQRLGGYPRGLFQADR
ncbi:MAG: FkbM family methyltransferase [Candidatus Eremiobacteraeota bacterium]|nr:FkbM family methyltransferase [Candidatus Eremiobacteraeota bacterium]